jgi:adenylosuccinate lyase
LNFLVKIVVETFNYLQTFFYLAHHGLTIVYQKINTYIKQLMSDQNIKLPELTQEQINHLIEVHERQKQQNKAWVEAHKEKVKNYHKEYFHAKTKQTEKYKEYLKSENRKITAHNSYLKRKEKMKLALIEKDKDN